MNSNLPTFLFPKRSKPFFGKLAKLDEWCYYFDMKWSSRRQLTYLTSVILFMALLVGAFYLVYKPAPTCFDQKQNQKEEGVDCGGPCARVCQSVAIPLKTYWARVFALGDGTYDVAALVENENQGLGIKRLAYTFKLFDSNSVEVAKHEGSTFVNPGEKFVIFESRIKSSQSYPAVKAFVELEEYPVWEKISPVPRIISIERVGFANEPYPVLRLKVKNDSFDNYRDIKINTVLSDTNQNAFAASGTFVEDLLAGESQEVFLTWPNSFVAEPSYTDSYWRINAFDLN